MRWLIFVVTGGSKEITRAGVRTAAYLILGLAILGGLIAWRDYEDRKTDREIERRYEELCGDLALEPCLSALGER